jgi:hypothetical protein
VSCPSPVFFFCFCPFFLASANKRRIHYIHCICKGHVFDHCEVCIARRTCLLSQLTSQWSHESHPSSDTSIVFQFPTIVAVPYPSVSRPSPAGIYKGWPETRLEERHSLPNTQGRDRGGQLVPKSTTLQSFFQTKRPFSPFICPESHV